jgi:hypothetical protein
MLQTAIAAWCAASNGFAAVISWFLSAYNDRAALQTHSARAWFGVVTNRLQQVHQLQSHRR